jgi:hypothetical protein
MIVLLIYVTLPPLFWLIQGGEYTSMFTGRLYQLQPSYDEQLYLIILGFSFLMSFIIAQWQCQKVKSLHLHSTTKTIPKSIFKFSLIIILAQFLIISGLQLTGVISNADSYHESYMVINQLPLALRQFIKILGGVAVFAEIVMLVGLFQRWRTHKRWIYLFIIFTLITANPEAGRAATFLKLFACLILWNHFVYRLKIIQLILIGVIGLVAFSAIGVYRGLLDSELDFLDLGLFDVGTGEFDILWGNAIELSRAKVDGYYFPPSLYLSEIYAFIPSFFLPFDKLSYSIWYLDEFYPNHKAAGGGLMFGLLAQLSIGLGVSESIIRGLLLGWSLGWLTRYLKQGSHWWSYPTLVYFSVWVFYTLRDSSFSLINNLIQVVFIGILVITIGSQLLLKKHKIKSIFPQCDSK